jgi:hypothetical protein
MVVFYSMWYDPMHMKYTFTRYLGNLILDDVDISYWAVPGTLED